MISEEVLGSDSERRVLIAAITLSPFLARISNKLPKEPLQSVWSNLLLSWCLSHYEKYQRAPNKQIESLFADFASSGKDKDTIKSIERLLSSLSGEYESKEEEDLEFLLDLAQKHFNSVSLGRLEESLKAKRLRGDTDNALLDTGSFRAVNLKSPPYVDVLRDTAAQERALQNKQRVLVSYQGAAGEFFGQELSENSFVAFMAPPKGMKSFMQLDIAWRALRQGRKVAYFQVGDLSESQIMGRFLKRAAYRPMYAKFCKVPIGIMSPQKKDELPVVEFESKIYEKDMSLATAQRAFRNTLSKTKGELRLFRHAVKTVSILDIKNTLEQLDAEGFNAQVVVVDYFENLSAPNLRLTPIEQIAETWAIGRQISEVRKCLLVTGAQTNKEGFSSWVLTRKNFRGNLMILAHVTAFFGVNRTEEEIDASLMRINPVVMREERFSESKCLWCATYLEAANPIVVSTL